MSDRHAIYLQLPVLVAISCGVTPVLALCVSESQIAGAIALATICSSTMLAAAWAAIFIVANLTSIGWVLLFATLVRCGGCHFGIPAVESQPSNADTEPSTSRISPPPENAR